MELGGGPTAIFAHNDCDVIGILPKLEELRRTQSDVAVVGYDNIALSRVLTTVDQTLCLIVSESVQDQDGFSTTSGARKMPDNNSKKSYIARRNA
jgi:hypothetical protein